MSEKPTNGAAEAAAESADGVAAVAHADQAPTDDEVEVEVEVQVEAGSDTGASPEGSGLDADDWAALVGQLQQQSTDQQQRLATLEQEKKDLYERMLRAVADADNARKRARKDVDEARIEARSRPLREILPVIDNLERAVQHAEQSDSDQAAVVEGVRLVLRRFTQALERCEVTAVAGKGVPFDPNIHEAISQQESADVEPGTVLEELQRGYKLGERLLRPALVVVASAPRSVATPAPPADDDNASSVGAGNGHDASADAAAPEREAEED